jgi:hypothetical protein
MSDRDLVRASTDFEGWDPDSIFSFSDTAINRHSPATPAKNDIRTAKLKNSRENDRDSTNVVESRSRGEADTFPETAFTGLPGIYGKVMGFNEISSDQIEKHLSEDERLNMMEEERWRRLEKEALSIKAAVTLRKQENCPFKLENELDVMRNKKGRQHSDDVRIEKSRLMKEATEDLLDNSMDNNEIQLEIQRKQQEMQLLRFETERLEKLDLIRKEKERLRRNQEIEQEKERVAFLAAEEEARKLSASHQGNDEEDDVGDDDSLVGNTESSSRNTDNNIPKNVPNSIPHSPRNVLIDFGESFDLDDSLDARGQYSKEENSRITANSGDNITAHSGESSSALLSFGKNGDFKGNGRDPSTGPGPHLSSSISASIWERGSAARTLQSVYRGVLGR